MTKKILIGILTVGVIVSLAGCGSIGEENMEDVASLQINEDTMEEDPINTTGTKAITSGDETETEIVYNEEDYEEQKDIFVYKNIDNGDGTQIDFTNEEHVDGPFILSESIDIYSYFFTYAGYTKPDIKINSVGRVGEWIFIPFAQSSFLVKAEDFDRAAVLKEKGDTNIAENNTGAGSETTIATQEITAPATTEDNVNSDNEAVSVSETVPHVEESAPAVTAYSEEEVISIVENALRNAGCRKPEEDMSAEELAMFGPTDGMGWGIDDIPMNDPYTAADKIVEGFQFGGWQYYYIESQGSSNGYVHLKLYSG